MNTHEMDVVHEMDMHAQKFSIWDEGFTNTACLHTGCEKCVANAVEQVKDLDIEAKEVLCRFVSRSLVPLKKKMQMLIDLAKNENFIDINDASFLLSDELIKIARLRNVEDEVGLFNQLAALYNNNPKCPYYSGSMMWMYKETLEREARGKWFGCWTRI